MSNRTLSDNLAKLCLEKRAEANCELAFKKLVNVAVSNVNLTKAANIDFSQIMNSVRDSVSPYANSFISKFRSMSPELRNALLGALAGGTLTGGASILGGAPSLGAALTGVGLGGALGAGVSALTNRSSGKLRIDPETAKAINEAAVSDKPSTLKTVLDYGSGPVLGGLTGGLAGAQASRVHQHFTGLKDYIDEAKILNPDWIKNRAGIVDALKEIDVKRNIYENLQAQVENLSKTPGIANRSGYVDLMKQLAATRGDYLNSDAKRKTLIDSLSRISADEALVDHVTRSRSGRPAFIDWINPRKAYQQTMLNSGSKLLSHYDGPGAIANLGRLEADYGKYFSKLPQMQAVRGKGRWGLPLAGAAIGAAALPTFSNWLING